MGRVVSAVTRLFFKLEGLDVFPWRWIRHPEDRWQGCWENFWPPARNACESPAWHVPQPLLSFRSELRLKSCLYAKTRAKTLIWPTSQWLLVSISCLTFACIKLNHFLFSRTGINPLDPSATAHRLLAP